MGVRPNFEETYPRYEFSELVRLGIAIGRWMLGMLRLARTPAPDARSAPAPADILPAD
jgi:hypothetical protein